MPIVQLEGRGPFQMNFLWDLDYDVCGFWDRFLTGMTEQPENMVNSIRGRQYEVKEFFRDSIQCAYYDYNRRVYYEC